MVFGFELLTRRQKFSIRRISIIYETRKILLYLGFCCLSDPIEIEYQQNEFDTIVVCKRKKFRNQAKNQDFVAVFHEDLKAILACENAEMRELHLGLQESEDQEQSQKEQVLFPIGQRIFEYLSNELVSRNDKVKIKNASLEITDSNQLMSVLPYLDSETLKNVELALRRNDDAVDIDNVVKSDAFNGKTGLEMYVALNIITRKGLETLREAFTSTPTFKTVSICYEQIDHEGLHIFLQNPNRLLQLDGQEVLKITHCQQSNRIWFSRILNESPNQNRKEKTPQNLLSEMFENPVILKTILKYVGCVDMQALRKVSSKIRREIISIRQDPRIQRINISAHGNELILVTYDDSPQISYESSEDECYVGSNHVPGNFREIFMNDFKTMLQNQEMIVKVVHLNFSKDLLCLELFRDHLRSRNQLLKVERLELEILSQFEITSILPFIDSSTLKSMELRCSGPTRFDILIAIDDVTELDQWTSLQSFVANSLVIYTPIREIYIDNLENADILLDTIRMDDLLYLKEKFLHSNNLIRFKIGFKHFSISDNGNQQWPGFDQHHPNAWLCPTPAPDQVLSVFYSPSKFVIFSRVDQSSIPENGALELGA
ncbi:hypothetical protein GCK72_019944 [Caenorhabditis remanei]|uniref:DUF38 domain-containing protein n=1 Tax=Caenorhabditis remanei TaxID=31234 RepID=A0A6A5GDR9_CAERE|nr:hypothetical protein GCK72_019944 [Caenorhabditis remanei]KAF1753387.1 hypothetical protein GCK72_019944 [Caenorhabditis remanei]